MKKIFWVASYPKSGNTWLRFILARLFFDISKDEKIWRQVMTTIPDMYLKNYDIIDAPEINLPRQGKISFAKTHSSGFPDLKDVENVGFIYIYRHPLDVLVSGINHAYVMENKSFFHNGCLRSVEELKSDGEINYYAKKFTEELKIESYYKMSNTWFNNVNTWLNIAEDSNMSIVMKYEDMLEDPIKEIGKLKPFFHITDEQVKKAVEFSQKYTNDGGKFFWKKKSQNYKEYLDRESIEMFNAKYGKLLNKIGYTANI
jgi:hypothetical protein